MPEDTITNHPTSTCPSSSEDEDPSPRTKELLQNYNGPKLGEPGRLGTKDLLYSIKKMDQRRKVSQDSSQGLVVSVVCVGVYVNKARVPFAMVDC